MSLSRIFQYSKSFLLKHVGRQIIRLSSNGVIDISHEVSHALMSRKPVVALESTIITHGMKYPHNLATAIAVENIIRQEGATPATIAVIDGRIKIGLCLEDLEVLSSKQDNCYKISRRDIPFIISQKLTGGTTVSGTMVIAHRAGIPVFVTGGVGGVHRNGESTMDISADLTELGRTPVAVISSGVKSILDIARTLEYLETQGVAVAAYGTTNNFPAFYTRNSGYTVPYCLNSPKEAAEFIRAIFDVQLNSGALIAVPIPEEHSFDANEIERAIAGGIEESNRRNIRGKDITPFLLEHVSQATKGESLKSNIALIKNNALIGARISVELSKLQVSRSAGENFSGCGVRGCSDSELVYQNADEQRNFEVVVVGGSNLDYVIKVRDSEIKTDGSMLSGKVSQSGGGVGRNVADALGKLDVDTFLISAIGTDDLGGSILKTVPHLTGNGLLRCDKYPTATCYVICDASGECKILIGDMEIHDKISVHYVKKHEEKILSSSLVVLDGNLPQDTIFYLLDMCGEAGVPVWFEPTDIVKATKAFSAGRKHFPQFISPNYNELVEISNVVNPGFSPPSNEIPWLFTCTEQAKLLVENVDNVLVTLGKLGVVIFRRGEVTDPFFVVQDSGKPKYLKRNSPISHSIHPQEKILEGEVVNASGAGDCFASGFIAAMLTGADENECVRLGFQCSLASLRCKKTVPDKFAQKSIGEKD